MQALGSCVAARLSAANRRLLEEGAGFGMAVTGTLRSDWALPPFFGVVVGVYQRLRHGEERIPYGPFLALAAMITLLWGDRIMWELFGFS